VPERVRRACMRYVQNRDEADDLAQEILIKVFGSGNAPPEGGWLSRVAANHCLDHLRREKRQRRREAVFALELREALVEEEPPGAALLELLRERVGAADRKLLHLRFDLGLKQADIAEMLGVTRVRVGQRLAGLLDMAARLQQKSTAPEGAAFTKRTTGTGRGRPS
jgi:RNA polymerase sigma factor (sigma-70 family)